MEKIEFAACMESAFDMLDYAQQAEDLPADHKADVIQMLDLMKDMVMDMVAITA